MGESTPGIKGGSKWRFNRVVDLAAPGRCTRQFAQSARKNAKCLLNPEKAEGRYYVRNVIRRARARAVKLAVMFLDKLQNCAILSE